MEKLIIKLMELEERRNDIEKVQKDLREQMITLDKDEYLEKEMIYYKNKEELKDINKKMEILNDALDIIGKENI